ncbi:hypothetical protein [Rhodococcus cercidiphylli]|uniref:Nucleotidyltransferase family protein n=1 Tax=Rhodococcus cercidiphylli TaxID=489916 RepID=A0ABU4B3F5_9NOCA|nr:hypothetical protein [Rhodococcus cercidiphylli]MDV6233028.1 hypothetical protein [Rhodococcus cercidiphylli]
MSEGSGLEKFWADFVALDENVGYFVTARLFEGTPAIWPEEVEYVRWRHVVADLLGVDPVGVQLVGSARLGYSLNPGKDFRIFHEGSDLDIAIVSQEIFESTWVELKSLLGSSEFSGQKGYLRRLVFDECIGTEMVLPRLSIGEKWSKSRDSISAMLGPDFRALDVNYRIYRNHRALRDYQIRGVSTARDRAIEGGVSSGR